MIRINLIRDRTQSVRRPPIEPQFTRLGVLALVILVLNAAVFGWWYRSLTSERAQLQQKREKLRTETVRLQSIYDKVKDYENQKKQLEERIQIIERLKENQVGPVELLTRVRGSVPEFMWLTAMSQSSNNINLEGHFLKEEVLPVFIQNLENTRHFSNVELLFYEKDASSGNKHRFSVRCQLAAAKR